MWGIQQRLQCDSEIDKAVTHEKEHRHDGCHVIQEGDQNAQLGDGEREAETANWLATPLLGEEPKVGDNVVFGDRLKEPRSAFGYGNKEGKPVREIWRVFLVSIMLLTN